MLKNQSLALLVIFLFSFSFSACNSAGEKGDPGIDGTDGTDGTSVVAGTGSYILTDANNTYLGYVTSLSDYKPTVYIITSENYILEINVYDAKLYNASETYSYYSTQDNGVGTVFISGSPEKDFGKRVFGLNNKLYSYKNINIDGSASYNINGTTIESHYSDYTSTWINKHNGSYWDSSFLQENMIINDLNELKEVQPIDVGLPITIVVPLKLVRL